MTTSAKSTSCERIRLQQRSAEGFGRRRDRALSLSIVSVYALRGINVAVNLISVPLAAGYLGVERYGLWLTASSIIGIMNLADLGLGNNLVTQLAHARGSGDEDLAARRVSATFWAVLAVAVALTTVLLLLHASIPWETIFNVTDRQAKADAANVGLMMSLIASAQLLSNLCQRIFSGLQRGYVGSIWAGLASIASLVSLYVTIKCGGSLPGMVLALGGVPVAVQLAGLFWVLLFSERNLFRPPFYLCWRDFGDVLRSGGLMFIVNLQAIFWLMKDNLLIAQCLGLPAVGPYNTNYRLFMTALLVTIASVGAGLWPAYTDAFARNDRVWIKRTFRRSYLVAGLLFCVMTATLVALSQDIVIFWAGFELTLPVATSALLGVYFLLLGAGNLLGFLLMGAGEIETIAWGGLLGGLISLPLCWRWMSLYGLSGAVLGNIVCNFIFQFLPLLVATRRQFRKLSASASC